MGPGPLATLHDPAKERGLFNIVNLYNSYFSTILSPAERVLRRYPGFYALRSSPHTMPRSYRC